jgi:aminoglycoside 3-N-acetyltransferase
MINRVKNILRKAAPSFILSFIRKRKKDKRRQSINAQLKAGLGLTKDNLVQLLKSAGIQEGKDLLVHCSFGNIGAVQNGPESLIEALLECIGEDANLLMPSSPITGYQLEYAKSNPVFDVRNTPSKLGALSEIFRKMPGVLRSAHPLEPVCVLGKNAMSYTSNHHIDSSAYGDNSPFKKLAENEGQILYLGVTLDNAGTSLHVAEEQIPDFRLPVYHTSTFDMKVVVGEDNLICKTKVHDPKFSNKRRCDELLPIFTAKNVAHLSQIGEAKAWVFDAKLMLEVLIEEYNKKGVTMYTPQGII